jgi:hypothetical protein
MQSDSQYFEEKMRMPDEPSFGIRELNWARDSQDQSKEARVARLEPDFTHSNFYVPAKVWSASVPDGPAACLWTVEPDSPEPITYRKLPPRYTMQERVVKGEPKLVQIERLSKEEAEARQRGEAYRIIEPLRRIDEDQNAYDLTVMFFGEFIKHPKGVHDDLIDAMSRVYDMDPSPAQVFDKALLDPPVYAD